MPQKPKAQLNNFLVETFNLILLGEERALQREGVRDLSMREMHVISSVALLSAEGKNTMSNIADDLFISAGALTTAVNVLISKGYLERVRSESDRRKVLVSLSEKGESVLAKHDKFHEMLVDHVASNLSAAELKLLVELLNKVRELTHSFVYLEEEK